MCSHAEHVLMTTLLHHLLLARMKEDVIWSTPTEEDILVNAKMATLDSTARMKLKLFAEV